MAARISKFDKSCIYLALKQKLRVLVATILIHSTTGMARGLIAKIQIVVLRNIGQIGYPCTQVAVAGTGSALASGRPEIFYLHPDRGAGLTSVTVRPIGKDPAAPKAIFHQFRIDVRIDQMRWRSDLRPCLPIVQIAAGIRGRCIELERGKWKLFGMRHFGSEQPGGRFKFTPVVRRRAKTIYALFEPDRLVSIFQWAVARLQYGGAQ